MNETVGQMSRPRGRFVYGGKRFEKFLMGKDIDRCWTEEAF